MLKWFLAALISFATAASQAQNNDWRTDYEKSNYQATPRYDATIAFCQRMAQASPWIHYTSFGTSPQGRELPLVIIDREGHFDPTSVHESGQLVLLIQAGIHAGEIDGKDAGLMLIRDIAITKKLVELLDHVTILFIPIYNVDGHERFGPYNRINQNGPQEMGWRVTAQNLNLNRDYLKADAVETQAWLQLFSAWLPDFFIDCHVTDGADYRYVVTYGLEVYGNMAPELTAWTRDVYLKNLNERMTKAGFPLVPYVAFRNEHDPGSGLVSWVASPRLSEGYTAVQNRPGLLIETHMLKDYRTRVNGTYETLKQTLILLNREQQRLQQIVKVADDFTASADFRRQPLAVSFKATRDSVMFNFLGVEFNKVKSDLSGGTWFQFGIKPVIYQVPFFNRQEPLATVTLPEAYIIPPEWSEVIRRLQLHGIECHRLTQSANLHVKSFRFNKLHWQEQPYEGRHPLQFELEEIEETWLFPSGSVVVDMNQRAARVVAHILEPKAPDSFVGWGFFDAIFEQKEYTESYVMEEMARKMLATDPDLKREFEIKKQQDADFGKKPYGILNWFYSKSPYWDDRLNVYPVGKIFVRTVVDSLLHQ